MLRALSLCACCRQYPGAATGCRLRSSHPAVSAFPEIAVGSACTSSFSRLARRSLALRPAPSRGHLYVTRYTEGFSHFVTSMTAPVASGWSVRRVGLAPTGKRPLVTAHTLSGHCDRRRVDGGKGSARSSTVVNLPTAEVCALSHAASASEAWRCSTAWIKQVVGADRPPGAVRIGVGGEDEEFTSLSTRTPTTAIVRSPGPFVLPARA